VGFSQPFSLEWRRLAAVGRGQKRAGSSLELCASVMAGKVAAKALLFAGIGTGSV